MLGIFNLKHPNVYTGFTAYLDKKNGAELAGSLNYPQKKLSKFPWNDNDLNTFSSESKLN